MSWAARRRLIISFIVGGVLILLLIFIGYKTFYRIPTCTDNKENQDETGIDCGGSCKPCKVKIIPSAISNSTYDSKLTGLAVKNNDLPTEKITIAIVFVLFTLSSYAYYKYNKKLSKKEGKVKKR